jgi:hypothetical protein
MKNKIIFILSWSYSKFKVTATIVDKGFKKIRKNIKYLIVIVEADHSDSQLWSVMNSDCNS